MEYDFAGLCADQLEKLDKKLSSFNKSLVKEYKFALNIINDPKANGNRPQIFQEIENILSDQLSKSVIFYTEALNKVQRVLKDNL